MPLSDSEDFESADEGTDVVERKGRKKRNSSSNYSDNVLENDPTHGLDSSTAVDKQTKGDKEKKEKDGWDDFDIADDQIQPAVTSNPTNISSSKTSSEKMVEKKQVVKTDSSKDTGWDDFGDDWGDDDAKKQQDPKQNQQQKDIKEITDRLAATSTTTSASPSTTPSAAQSSGWGWGGWGVDSLLSTASAGISTISNQVSQGISTVLESGMGIPDPEELAKQTVKERDSRPETENAEGATETPIKEKGDGYSFGSLFKFVGDTGSKVITGGLDTLETIGRKTMEVLQEGDPMLAKKKRAMLGFFDPDKPVLSQVLREAKMKSEEEDKIKEEKREAKEVHYENLFDDFEGLVHLEALEMLSKRVGLQIEERVQNANPNHRQDVKETLEQVADLCQMPEEEEEEDESDSDEEEKNKDLSKPELLLQRLQKATQDLGVKLQFQPLIKQYTEVLAYLSDESNDFSDKTMYKKAVSCLAQSTALSVELYHKAGEMLLVKTRRYTADEADGILRLTIVLTKHITELATLFTQQMDQRATYLNATECNNYITNIFLEAENSSTYIQNALQLAQPIVQIGAI